MLKMVFSKNEYFCPFFLVLGCLEISFEYKMIYIIYIPF